MILCYENKLDLAIQHRARMKKFYEHAAFHWVKKWSTFASGTSPFITTGKVIDMYWQRKEFQWSIVSPCFTTFLSPFSWISVSEGTYGTHFQAVKNDTAKRYSERDRLTKADPVQNGWGDPEAFWVNEHYLLPDWIKVYVRLREP